FVPKRKPQVSFLHTLTAIACLLAAGSAFAWPATVVRVLDGDTIIAINNNDGNRYRVRLAGIDAPEIGHGAGRAGQPYGRQAKTALSRYLDQQRVAVLPNGSRSYGRIVATVTVNGRDVAHALVRNGLAWDYRDYDPREAYTADQRRARRGRRGL